MIVKVNKVQFNPEACGVFDDIRYDLDIPDDKLIKEIMDEFPTYWYALIDGRLFKSDSERGSKGIFFKSKDELEFAISQALYWKKKLVPDIGVGVGYDCEDFYIKLKESHNIKFKTVQF